VWPVRSFAPAALLAVLLVLAFELFVYSNRQKLQWSLYNMAEIKGERLRDRGQDDEVAIFGDSRFFHADPAAIGRALGVRAGAVTNYAWPWSGVEVFESQLRTALRDKPHLGTIVMPQFPLLVGYADKWTTIRASRNLQLGYQLVTSWRDGLVTLFAQHYWTLAWQQLCSHVAPPSSANQKVIRVALKNPLQGKPMFTADPEFLRMRDDYDQRGWFSFAPETKVNAADAAKLEQGIGGFAVQHNPAVRETFERFLALADRAGIHVLMVPLPVAQVNYDRFEQTGIHAEWDKQVHVWAQKYRHLHVLGETSEVVFELPLLGDMVHVNNTGAREHMRYVSGLLKDFRGSSR
jgi:hypothetical protein